MSDRIIARWYKAKHILIHDVIELEGSRFAYLPQGNPNPNAIYKKDMLLTKWPESTLAKVVIGKFGPPDWTIDETKTNPSVEPVCVCSIESVCAYGCPSCHGQKCRSK